jgi:hypothetical protein
MENMFSIIRSIEFPLHDRNKPQLAYPPGAALLLRRLAAPSADGSRSLVTTFRPAHYISDTQFETIVSKCPALKRAHPYLIFLNRLL